VEIPDFCEDGVFAGRSESTGAIEYEGDFNSELVLDPQARVFLCTLQAETLELLLRSARGNKNLALWRARRRQSAIGGFTNKAPMPKSYVMVDMHRNC
jgi:hypothetical protein